MKTAVMKAIGKIELEEREIPQPKEGEVLIKIGYVGICGSDVHYFETGAIGDFVVKPPFVLGHEAAGTVVALGEGVDSLKIGDRVAMEPGKTCGHCEFCRTGRYNLCPDVQFFATPPYDGVFQEYVAYDASMCFRLPDNVSLMEGALIEPLAVGFHAANQGGAHIGQKAVVFGSGCIGLMCLLALKAEGVTEVYVVDVIDKRLEKAMELGAAGVINSSKEDAVERIMELAGGYGVDLAIDTAGADVTINQGIRMVKPGGTIVCVGYSRSGKVTLDMSVALNKEITFRTVFRYRHIYPMAIAAVSSGLINLRNVVTDTFTLDEIQEAMMKSVNDKVNIVKAVIEVAGE
ncbi:MAG: NAD(P)-dependent alcohol dehydrogenase [Spirochaetes bacterium]|uniref:NAD(P)-dependent alcohol dehydrogenase n=1 Tax=Candidatus Ornithospirochaeta stercoravium TaxID=2840897 RepID=A0A9D9IAI0_9SPIO|nr:NAD(P)-dependent alcohol dehydrogenase [Candidatus Ornithospirochaeta stercoravium]